MHVSAAVLLQALSAGREWQLLAPQLLTPKGYKLLRCCHMALEQLQRVLALQQNNGTGSAGDLEAAARLAVGLMCEGRLVPTTWLNQVRVDKRVAGMLSDRLSCRRHAPYCLLLG